ncbi:MAG: flavodoxin [Pirellulales bacterium]
MAMAIFYGSSTGNTQMAAEKIKETLGEFVEHVADVAKAAPEDFAPYDVLFLGVSTWNIGEMQDDWADFLPKLDQVDFTGKKVALFAMGDAVGYPHNFLDAMGELWQKIQPRGAELIGAWPTEGYTFEESAAMFDEDHFLGLGLDEDNESDQTDDRIQAWLVQVLTELGFGVEA